MKKLAYFLIGCIIVGLIISMLFTTFPVFTVIGRGFLVSLSNQQYEQAYSMCSDNFQQHISFEQFKNNVEDYSLNQYEEVIWTAQDIAKERKYAIITGEVKTKNKRKIEVQFEFIQVQGASYLDKGWRIDSLKVRDLSL